MSLKICVVGCGWVSDAMHGPSYQKCREKNPGIVLLSCCDIDISKAENFKNKYSFQKAYSDMETMLDEERPGAVCLNAPAHLNAKLAAKVLERGIPLLVEKPPGETEAEVLRLIEVAERENTPNQVAFNRRYAPLARRLKEIINNANVKDEIQSVSYYMYRVNRFDEDFSTTAIHAIDTARHIAGSDYARARFEYKAHEKPGVTDIYMYAETERGAAVNIHICPVTGIDTEGAVIHLRGLTVYLDILGNAINPSGRLTVVENNKITLDITGNDTADGPERFEREGFFYENYSFFEDIIAGRKPSGDLKTSLQSAAAADCIRRRAKEYIMA